MFSKDYLNEDATYQLNKTAEMEIELDRNYFIYKTGNKKKDKTYDFWKFKTIRSFGIKLSNNNLSLDDALEQWIRLKDDFDIYKESTKPKQPI